jgi:hypothetical protein
MEMPDVAWWTETYKLAVAAHEITALVAERLRTEPHCHVAVDQLRSTLGAVRQATQAAITAAEKKSVILQ